jgi:flagellar protein FliJ
MKKFAFRLETLLQHRIKIEEKERDKFSLLRAELLAELSRKEKLGAQQAETLSELLLQKSCASDSQEIGWFYRFLDRLAHEIKRSYQRVVELERSVEAQKQVMIEASRKKQMIENLKKKRQREYLVAMEREDQKNIDEIVVTRFAQRP